MLLMILTYFKGTLYYLIALDNEYIRDQNDLNYLEAQIWQAVGKRTLTKKKVSWYSSKESEVHDPVYFGELITL